MLRVWAVINNRNSIVSGPTIEFTTVFAVMLSLIVGIQTLTAASMSSAFPFRTVVLEMKSWFCAALLGELRWDVSLTVFKFKASKKLLVLGAFFFTFSWIFPCTPPLLRMGINSEMEKCEVPINLKPCWKRFFLYIDKEIITGVTGSRVVKFFTTVLFHIYRPPSCLTSSVLPSSWTTPSMEVSTYNWSRWHGCA